MKKIIILIILIAAYFITGHFAEQSRPGWKRISPFTAVNFNGETILAEYEKATYELVSIEAIASEDLVAAAQKRFGNKWQKRIREDIAEVLQAAGAPEVRFVDLELKDPATGEVKRVFDVEMTEENRSKAYDAS